MKISDIKHNHSLTDLLKVLLFAILMLAPIGMVATKCLYAICNKNAYQSYSDNYVEKLTQVNSTNLINEYAEYQVNYSANSGSPATIYVNDTNLYDYIDTNNKTIDSIAFINETYARINLNFTDSTSLRVNNWNDITNSFYITMKSTTFDFTTQLTHANLYLITYQNEKLDNVFEYSVSQLEQSTLFNWTQNTAIYSGIEAMNSQLGINAPAISILLAYWFLLSVIYIIIDIIIKSFTILTHMITKKA